MKNSFPFARLSALLLLMPVLAQAHPGHGGADDFGHGLIHPFTGWDHILAIVAVTIWSVQLGRRALWLLPAVFIGGMAIGSFVLPAVPSMLVQSALTGSLLVLGLLAAAAAQLPLTKSIAIVGGFALLHGGAHGAGMSGPGEGFASSLGVVGMSAVILVVFGVFAQRAGKNATDTSMRWAGAAIAVAGVMLNWPSTATFN